MKRIVHPPTTQADIQKHEAKKLEQDRVSSVGPDKALSDVSIDGLIGDGLLCLDREMRNLKFATARGKLSAPEAKDLRDTVKLLFELKDREKELLEALGDEDLEKASSTKINE
jgi:hypothetical protein